MPYKSAKQRRYLHAKKPEVAARFDAEIRKGRVKRGGNKHPRKRG